MKNYNILIVFILISILSGCGGKNYLGEKIVVSTTNLKYSLQGTTQGRYLTGGVPPVRFSM